MTIQSLDVQRVAQLPAQVVANTMYFVKPNGQNTGRIFLTNNSGAITAEAMGDDGPQGPAGPASVVTTNGSNGDFNVGGNLTVHGGQVMVTSGNAVVGDFNNYSDNSIRRVANIVGNNIQNGPPDVYGWGMLEVQQFLNSNYVVQKYYPHGNSGEIHWRIKWNGVWNNWEVVAGPTSTGRLPAFYACAGGWEALGLVNGQVVPFPTVSWNVGGHYDPATSRFFAPTTSLYQFGGTLFNTYSAGGNTRFALARNGVHQVDGYLAVASNTNGDSPSGSRLINLNAGDYVDMRFASPIGEIYKRHSAFWGVKIG